MNHPMNEPVARRSALLALGAHEPDLEFNWIVMKRVLHYIGPFDFSALRSLLGTLLLFAVLWWRGESLAPPRRGAIRPDRAWRKRRRFQLLVQLSLVEGGAGKMALLAYTMPFWVIAACLDAARRTSEPAPMGMDFGLAAAGLALVMEPWRAIGGLLSCLLALAGGALLGFGHGADQAPVPERTISPLRLTAWQMLFGNHRGDRARACVHERAIDWSAELMGR